MLVKNTTLYGHSFPQLKLQHLKLFIELIALDGRTQEIGSIGLVCKAQGEDWPPLSKG